MTRTYCPGSGIGTAATPGQRDKCPYCGHQINVTVNGKLFRHNGRRASTPRRSIPVTVTGPVPMRVIVRPRQAGKTTELIRLAAEHFAYIVVPNQDQARHVFDMARKLKLDIPFPITWAEFAEARYHGARRIRGFAVDNLDDCLAQMAGMVPVVGVTATGPTTDGFDYDGSGVKIQLNHSDQYGRRHVRVQVGDSAYVGWMEPAAPEADDQ